jgi:hypothetical protein
MKERPPEKRERDPYWTADIGLFEGRFRSTRDEPQIVRARVHTSEERYHLDQVETEIVPITQRTGRAPTCTLSPISPSRISA